MTLTDSELRDAIEMCELASGVHAPRCRCFRDRGEYCEECDTYDNAVRKARSFFGTHGESILRELSTLRARVEELERLGREMREAQDAESSCVKCSSDLLRDADVPHCEDCIIEEQHLEAWEELSNNRQHAESDFDAAIARGKA